MIEIIKEETVVAMDKTMQALSQNLAKIRSGRAHPSMVQHIMVEYYGNMTPLNQVANVGVDDARTISITAWERNMVAAIEKAIMTSDFGITPNTNGNVIRLPLPALTEARRKEMIKLVKNEAEKCKVSIRNARKDANSQIKELNKNKEISNDQLAVIEQEIQTLTDKYISKISNIIVTKEKNLLEV